jgi:hypothetical protein
MSRIGIKDWHQGLHQGLDRYFHQIQFNCASNEDFRPCPPRPKIEPNQNRVSGNVVVAYAQEYDIIQLDL